MTDDRRCRECRFSGMDMDMDPYCAHARVIAEHPYGLVLHSLRIATFCPGPEKPLFEERKDQP